MNLRLIALTGAAVACALTLSLAPASVESGDSVGSARSADAMGPGRSDGSAGTAGSPGSGAEDSPAIPRTAEAARDGGAASAVDPDAKPASDPTAVRDSPSGDPGRGLLGLGVATAARCGPAAVSPAGVEAQACVMAQGERIWARAAYRNTGGHDLDAVLSLTGPLGPVARTRCVVGAGGEPASCETSRERTRGGPARYSAVVEIARRGEEGPPLLRSGSDPRPGG
jgi:hypothetical protein